MEIPRVLSPPLRATLAVGVGAVAVAAFAHIPVPTGGSQSPVGATTIERSVGAPLLAAKSLPPAPPASDATSSRNPTPAGPQLARTGAIELFAPDVERALVSVGSVARSQGAVITAMTDERPPGEGQVHHAEVTLSVPATAFESTLRALGGIARVRSRTIGAEDVSDKLVDAGARLRNLRRTELDLLKIMDRSGRVSEIMDVERELSSVRDQIERTAAEVAATQRRVARAQIDVSVVEDAPVRIVEPELRAQIAGSWQAALDQVKGFTLAAIARAFVLVAFAPYLLALALAFVAARAMFRGRSRKVAAATP